MKPPLALYTHQNANQNARRYDDDTGGTCTRPISLSLLARGKRPKQTVVGDNSNHVCASYIRYEVSDRLCTREAMKATTRHHVRKISSRTDNTNVGADADEPPNSMATRKERNATVTRRMQ